MDSLLEIDWLPSSDFDSATFTISAETSVGDIILAESSVDPGRKDLLYTAGSIFRVSNALSKMTINLIAQIQGEESMLCVKVPSVVFLSQGLLI